MQTKDTDLLHDPTLAKLLEVDSDLAVQEAELEAQLQEIQQKRNSLKTVIGLFKPEETLAAPATQSTDPLLSVQATTEEMNLIMPPPESSTISPSDDDVTQEQRQPHRISTQAAARRTKRRRASAPTLSGKAESWRPYVREEFGTSAALPEMVATVLQRLPERVFEIPEIINAIYVNEIPREVYQKARARLLSVLSQGVKQNKWQRGDKGQYSGIATDS